MSRWEIPEIMQGYGDVAGAHVTPEQFQNALPREVSFATAFGGFTDFCRALIAEGGHKRVCEIGGGRRPLLARDEADALGIDYAILDISQSELDRAAWPEERIVADVSAPTANIPSFDFVFSRMLAEHVPDGHQMHRNLFECVSPGGRALHFFPTLYSPAFVANKLLPTGLSSRLQQKFAPRSHPKFPALYSMCVGPRRRQLRQLTDIGWEVEQYRVFYGDSYLDRIPVVRDLGYRFWLRCADRRSTLFCSFAFLVLRKPSNAPISP